MAGRSSLKVPRAQPVEWLRRVDPAMTMVPAVPYDSERPLVSFSAKVQAMVRTQAPMM